MRGKEEVNEGSNCCSLCNLSGGFVGLREAKFTSAQAAKQAAKLQASPLVFAASPLATQLSRLKLSLLLDFHE